jgi:anti-anti-sigma factor
VFARRWTAKYKYENKVRQDEGPPMMELQTSTDLLPVARLEERTLVASVRGEIDLHNSSELRTELLDLLRKHTPVRLVLNLGEVPYMDSSAVAVLVETLRRLRTVGGKVVLTDLQPRVLGLLEIARLAALFTIAKDEAEGMTK